MDSTLSTIRKLAEKKSFLKTDVETRYTLLYRLKNRLTDTEHRDYLRQSCIYNNLFNSYESVRESLEQIEGRLEEILSKNETKLTRASTSVLSRMVAEHIISQNEAHIAIRAVVEKRLKMEDYIKVMVDRPRQRYHPSQGNSYQKRCEVSLMELRVFLWTYSQPKKSLDYQVAELMTSLRISNLPSINIVAERKDY